MFLHILFFEAQSIGKTRSWKPQLGAVLPYFFAFVCAPFLCAQPAAATALAYDWSAPHSETETLTTVLDTAVLQHLQSHGFSLGETLDANKASKTSLLYSKLELYRDFADLLGKNLQHDVKTDQLPENIPAASGDIPEMVRLFRNFEDKGARSNKDKKAGFFIRHLSNNSQYPYRVEYDGDEPRHFDTRWLNSDHGYFQLVALVNRVDRRDFSTENCGEVRFIYRLSYRSPKSASTLPFFVNVVHQYSAGDCVDVAKKWQITPKRAAKLRRTLQQNKTEGAQKIAQFLRDAPLQGSVFKQLEVNFQALRFTSGYMHDFGGQALYMQRIFQIRDENRLENRRLVPVRLENTPDVLAIQKDPQLLGEFIDFLAKKENLMALDEGRLVVDFSPQFLATRAVSWSTLGRARLANKPYRRLLEQRPDLTRKLDLKSLKNIRSVNALLERLDNLTCMGCHQSNGTAGFHMLGLPDPKFAHSFNQQELPFSPHFFAEQHRRRAYGQALSAGKMTNRFRPHSNFPRGQWAKTGAPTYEDLPIGSMCLLQPENHFSKSPICAPLHGKSTECLKTAGSSSFEVLFGECVLQPTKYVEDLFAGGTCFRGEVQEKLEVPSDRGPIPTFNFFSFQDKFTLQGRVHQTLEKSKKPTERYSCGSPKGGAPLGRRGRRCTLEEETFKVIDGWHRENETLADLASFRAGQRPAEICANQGGNGFDMCAARGDSGACLESRVARAMLDTCSAQRFCREDYICQKLPYYHEISKRNYTRKRRKKRVNSATPGQIDGDALREIRDAGVGFCVPTYFIFNMRVDGHPSPVTGLSPGKPVIDRSQPLRGYRD